MSDIEQRTEEWFQARLGKVTSSRVHDVMAMTKSGPSKSRDNYMAELVCERLTGRRADHFESAEMRWGTDTEPIARAVYEAVSGNMVDKVGFVEHPTIPNWGGSPDGMVGEDGITEIKCPNTATHINTLLTGKIDQKYIDQMLSNMECTGRIFCDFVSFDPRMPDHAQLFIKQLMYDDFLLRSMEIEQKVKKFLFELTELEQKLKSWNL